MWRPMLALSSYCASSETPARKQRLKLYIGVKFSPTMPNEPGTSTGSAWAG